MILLHFCYFSGAVSNRFLVFLSLITNKEQRHCTRTGVSADHSPRDPYKLTPGEDQLIRTLQASFLNSDKLQKHIRLLFSKGSMYLIVN